jgi:PAS domain S-box-containing protein
MEETEPPHIESEAPPKSREIHRALMAYSPDAILGVNRKGTIVFWNRGAERVFGYSSSEMLGRPLTRLISKKDRESHALSLSTFLTGNCGETALIEGEALRKDGSTFPLELSLSIEHQNGLFFGLAVGRNITHRRNTQQALMESAQRYCGLLATCLEAVFSADVPDNSGAGGKALDRLGDYCLEELTEMKPKDIPSSESREHLSRQIDKILNADEPISSIVHGILRKNGKRILIERYLSSISEKAKSAGFDASGFDNTEGKVRERQLKDRFQNLANIICHVIESYDPYTAEHQQRVAALACLVGENMGLAADTVERLYLDGLLHDIGKVSIPRSILTKPGELAEEEWALIRAHTKQGYSILKDANLPWPIADVALQHHERLDGSGYPNGITEDKLGPEVSILAVCDVVEAMSSHRPYRPARTTRDVLKELRGGRGTKYNVSVVDVMLPMIESGEFKRAWHDRDSKSGSTAVLGD